MRRANGHDRRPHRKRNHQDANRPGAAMRKWRLPSQINADRKGMASPPGTYGATHCRQPVHPAEAPPPLVQQDRKRHDDKGNDKQSVLPVGPALAAKELDRRQARQYRTAKPEAAVNQPPHAAARSKKQFHCHGGTTNHNDYIRSLSSFVEDLMTP